jgi:hypothetical protein
MIDLDRVVGAIADPESRRAVEAAIAAMCKAAEMRPLPDYGILLALRNGAEAIEQFNDRVAARSLAEVAVDLTSHPKISLDTARSIVKQGYDLAVEARTRNRIADAGAEFLNRPYRIPQATVDALEYVIRHGDADRLRKFLSGRPHHETTALISHIEHLRNLAAAP